MGYVIIAAVLFLLGLSFNDILSKLDTPTEMPLTEGFFISFYFWIVFLLTTPVMTIRAFALERFSGTYETLMTSAVRDAQVVLAKFTGALAFFALTWLPLLAYLLVVRRFSDDPSALDFRVVASTFWVCSSWARFTWPWAVLPPRSRAAKRSQRCLATPLASASSWLA